ncbi:sirohydrochlorin cobaltochelatase/precorrin-2/cobalt-factor-2 C20-methyltransferase [Pseudobutyrivibrio sp. 49]|uniref:precorrin-2 C(20)-methyltransferase n=1 Tax=unclassified Pseudobutyrivibrio TaxID=2638619 RepID=UPI0008822BAC|nr:MULTISPECIES: precorrin-2 C(20)-methyltransferase [unclassified Pseudobutyrivibrio]SDH80410.1 sirohydrochlorin cobaltochelatase/precorrin-2/cobalt-factor-2 C20-methyltransferase [Pseudobutyrivibrio sp. 49]SFO02408.1 precorrin-2/cobalt-factor-2 C20-methyltransferase [Pseudobutyrivibrio sp. UC1225]
MAGILYGIGVGPGDPEMLTLRAVRAIKEADVICLPKADKYECRAFQIALPAVPELKYKKTISYDFEMTRDEEALAKMHAEFYEKYRQLIMDGYNLAFLTIGDPTVYSTFGYIMKLAKKDCIEVEIINGITSFCGSAAAAGILLSERDENIHIISGQGNLEEELKLSGTKIIMKSGRNISEIKERLLQLEQADKISVYAVIDCGMETEQIFNGAMMIPDDSKYMMTIIIKDKV